MIVLGLTGSIGMGKSTAAALFRRLGVPVFDADASVHHLQSLEGKALPMIASTFPGTVGAAGLDRSKLRLHVFDNPAALKKLEAIMHPLVKQAQQHWLRVQAQRRQTLVVLDVPLLFEKGGWRSCDVTAVVTAPYHIQKTRVLSRPGMTEATFQSILKLQLPDPVKCTRASYLIRSGRGRRQTMLDVQAIIQTATKFSPRIYPAGLPGAALPPRKRKPSHA
jgi:dephospho-CoA kinase